MSAELRAGSLPQSQAKLFHALGDATRLGLLSRLADGRASIVELARGTGMTRQGVTKHLRMLEGAGLVHTERAGRESLYCLDPKPLAHGRAFFAQFSGHLDAALARLKAKVEEKS